MCFGASFRFSAEEPKKEQSVADDERHDSGDPYY